MTSDFQPLVWSKDPSYQHPDLYTFQFQCPHPIRVLRIQTLSNLPATFRILSLHHEEFGMTLYGPVADLSSQQERQWLWNDIPKVKSKTGCIKMVMWWVNKDGTPCHVEEPLEQFFQASAMFDLPKLVGTPVEISSDYPNVEALQIEVDPSHKYLYMETKANMPGVCKWLRNLQISEEKTKESTKFSITTLHPGENLCVPLSPNQSTLTLVWCWNVVGQSINPDRPVRSLSEISPDAFGDPFSKNHKISLLDFIQVCTMK